MDLSGWSFSGITLTLPAGTTIGAGGYLVVAKDAVQFQATYGFAPAAVYGGNLSNSGETVALRDATAATIDTVSFLDVDPWPVKADGTGPSLELVDASLDNNDPLNWAAATNGAGRTPGAANSVRRVGLGPRVTNVVATPTTPTASQPVTVTATITGQTSAVLRYRIDFAAEQTVTMTSSGPDAYTATIPGAAAGTSDPLPGVRRPTRRATTLVPRVDDTIVYRGLVVPHGITSPIPIIEWFIADADYNFMVANPLDEIVRFGAIAYNGQVIDNVEMNIKGHASRQNPKVSWKFHTPQGHDLAMPGLLVEPVDEFDMQADWADRPTAGPSCRGRPTSAPAPSNHQMFPIRSPAQRCVPGRVQPPGDQRRHLARARGVRRQAVLRGRDQRLLHQARQRAVLEEGARRDRLRAHRGVHRGRPAHRDRPAQLPAGQRGHPADDQLRRGHRDHRAPRLVVEELLHVPGPRDRPVEHHPVGPRPHPRQRLLPGRQQLRHPRRAG